MRFCLFGFFLLCLGLAGCGTTRWTDSARTATEQMLISDAIERSVSRLDFRVLDGQTVYLDPTYLAGVVDRDYLISTLRQHMVANGCVIKDKKEDADFILEARAGAVGTDRHDLLVGMPSINLPWTPMQGSPAALPEVAVARRTDQKGVAKVAVFAYHRATGQPVWQSGVDLVASKAQNSWWLGMGPIQRGTIYDKAQFAGGEFRFPLFAHREPEEPRTVRVTRETKFNDPQRFALRSSDALAKFGESLRLNYDAAEKAAGVTSLAAADGSLTDTVNLPTVYGTWPKSSVDVPSESQVSGQLISSPPNQPPGPVARLIGPRTSKPVTR